MQNLQNGDGRDLFSMALKGFCQTPLQLANPTQLQLVGVGVDTVFPRKKEEGRRKKEGRKNPHLNFSRRNDPSCLNFGDCLVGV